jgi:molybdopterin/thiamine biosynthesis adenylyltransferase
MARPKDEVIKDLYARQTILKEMGIKNQEKILLSKVAVIGLGGLGSSSSLYLTLAGVGFLRLIDQDIVELHNLHRQALYTPEDVRYPKVEVAAKRLQKLNPHLQVDPIAEHVRHSNVDELIEGMDCVIDGLDNMETRYILNASCVRHGTPYVFGGAIGLEGNITIFNPPETPCLECVFPSLDDRYLQHCDTRGVLGTTVGIVASIQAMETIKLITGIGESLKNRLMVCDFKKMDFMFVDLLRTPSCSVCGIGSKTPTDVKEKLSWLCGRNTANVNPAKLMSLDLNKVQKVLSINHRILVKSPLVLVFEYENNIEVSLFRQGRMLLRNVKSEETALEIYREIIGKINHS